MILPTSVIPQAAASGDGEYHLKVFDARTAPLVEEAIVLGALPQFTLTGGATVDLRGMPPTVAQAYVMTVLQALLRGLSPR